MQRSKFTNGKLKKCVHKSTIQEEMVLIEGSETDYITRSGKVYADYGNDMFYPKSTFVNKHNHYVYTNVMYKDNPRPKSRRLHILLAKAFLHNPFPDKYNIVGHLDNNKSNNSLDNLYWTSNQDNTQKAVDDGLNVPKKGADNVFSIPIKVLDKNTYEIVGVYGSIREYVRHIKNISEAMVSKMITKENYKPRLKKYIYQRALENDLIEYSSLLNVDLTENKVNDKRPIEFIMSNYNTGFSQKFDNQTQASKICGIDQATISAILRKGITEYQGWCFKTIGKINYINSSAYDNLIATEKDVVLQNIGTGEIRVFETCKQLKDEFNLRGHDINQYVKSGHTLLNQWKVIGRNEKVTNV